MASSTQYCLFFSISTLLLLFFNASPVLAQQSFRPKALVIPVSKDASTLQYTTHITQRTPLVPINLVLDLGGQFLWVDCEQNYVSSTYRPARCRSAQCSLARASGCGDCFSSPKPGCNNNTCGLTPDNTVTGTATGGELAYDVVSVPSTNGFNPGRNVSVSQFLFTCAPTFLLEGLAAGVSGMAGLGRTRISLPSQFASAFSFDRKFAICLSSSVSSNGVVFFGDGPYVMLPNVDVSESLIYTPLFINPVSTASAFSQGEASSEYFIKVNSIKVNEKPVAVNTTLLSIDRDGVGGTKISTVNPYTVLEASIFKAVTEAFISESKSMNITRVSSVGPFEVCFSRDNVLSTRVGPAVPSIDLVLQNESTFWRVFGANSMARVDFINGGPPCQGFSGMNRFNQSTWSKVQCEMILAFLSFADYFRPKYFLLENVRNFVSFNKGQTFRLTLASLLEMGYQVRFGILEAGAYGVSQSRKRAFIWAAAPGEILPEWPEPMHVFGVPELKITLSGNSQYAAVRSTASGAPFRSITVRDTIGDLPAVGNGASKVNLEYESDPISWFQKKIRGEMAVLTDHISKEMNELNLIRCQRIPKRPGADWQCLPDEKVKLSTGQIVDLIPWCLPNTAKRHNQWKGLFGRLDWEGNFPTSITDPQPMGKVGMCFHPDQDRILTVRECARSQGFADSYQFSGTILHKHRQIGNAVPPTLAYALGTKLKEAIDSKRLSSQE